ncbi:MAG: LytTR family DNA-binding domain-containing protein [Eubacteriales bacterium]|nr:LytTR family DNA-binding domain-containing protein [Eubacteriales bacterium]
MIRIAIVEDESMYSDTLQQYLERYGQEIGEVFQTAVYSDGDEILENYKGQYDIILMDIEMQYMDGMSTAEEIRKSDQKVIIIFITRVAQYAIRGYAVDALDYVLKPVSYFAFTQRLGRAISRMRKRETRYITITSKSGILNVALSDLIWIESRGHRVVYYTVQQQFESTVYSMKELEKKLI